MSVSAVTAQGVLEEAVAKHHPSLALACSFQKEETVLIHMLQQITPDARVFTIDTGVLFPETYATWRELEQKTGVKVEVHDATTPRARPGAPATAAAPTRSPRWSARWTASTPGSPACAASSPPPAPTPGFTEWDEPHGLWKFNPLADWTEKDVWNYIAEHDLPYNPLHDRGYSSIGCAPCTLPGSGREGRWAGSEKTECGLHVVEG